MKEGTWEMLNIDWTIVALDVCRCRDMSKLEKAELCRMGPNLLDKLANEYVRHPRWHQGVLLLDLHATLCPEKHTPRRLIHGR